MNAKILLIYNFFYRKMTYSFTGYIYPFLCIRCKMFTVYVKLIYMKQRTMISSLHFQFYFSCCITNNHIGQNTCTCGLPMLQFFLCWLNGYFYQILWFWLCRTCITSMAHKVSVLKISYCTRLFRFFKSILIKQYPTRK